MFVSHGVTVLASVFDLTNQPLPRARCGRLLPKTFFFASLVRAHMRVGQTLSYFCLGASFPPRPVFHIHSFVNVAMTWGIWRGGVDDFSSERETSYLSAMLIRHHFTHGGQLDCHPSLSHHLHALQRASVPGQSWIIVIGGCGQVTAALFKRKPMKKKVNELPQQHHLSSSLKQRQATVWTCSRATSSEFFLIFPA